MANPRPSDLTEQTLNSLYLQNYHTLHSHMARAAGATTHAETIPLPDGSPFLLQWTDAGPSPADPFHSLAPLGPEPVPAVLAAAAVGRVRAHFAGGATPARSFRWLVGPHAQPEVEHALRAEGCVLDEEEPAMAVDLDELEGRVAALAEPAGLKVVVAGEDGGSAGEGGGETGPADLVITPVRDAADAAEWVDTWAFPAPAETRRQWASVYADLVARLPARELSMFVGRMERAEGDGGAGEGEGDGRGKAVGTGYVWCAAGVAAVHYIVTLPEYRRRGIGGALTVHAMRLARERGCRTAVLTASPFGIGVYRRLGFKEFGNVKTYVWNPS